MKSTILGIIAGILFFIFEVSGLGDLSGAPFGIYIAYLIPALIVFVVVKYLTNGLDEPDLTPEGKAIIDSIRSLNKNSTNNSDKEDN